MIYKFINRNNLNQKFQIDLPYVPEYDYYYYIPEHDVVVKCMKSTDVYGEYLVEVQNYETHSFVIYENDDVRTTGKGTLPKYKLGHVAPYCDGYMVVEFSSVNKELIFMEKM